MEFPNYLKEYIESQLAKYETYSVRSKASRIMDNYKNNTQKGMDLIDSELAAEVYAFLRMPATFASTYQALEYVKEFYKGDINSVIDIGAGTGAASLACSYLFDSSEMILLERNKFMKMVGEKILLQEEKLANKYSYKDFDLVGQDIESTGDLSVSSYVFNEFKPDQIKELITKMWKATNKVMLVVEPGTPIGHQVIQEIRKHILSLGGHIIAPCPHEGDCPLNKDDWCHFATRLSRSKLYKQIKGADVPYEDEKYAYIAFSKEEVERCSSRVLRHPIIRKSLVTLELCSKDGINKLDVSKKDNRYKKARKIGAGDSF